MKNLLTVALIIASLFCCSVTFGETIYSEYKYTMGDNDTKNDAKRICFIEAKRLLIEKAGTYIESSTTVRDFRLSKDEINTFAAAFLKVEVVSESIKSINDVTIIYMKLKADVDTRSFRSRVDQMKQDKDQERRILEQQKQLETLENSIRDIQKQLVLKDYKEQVQFRKERQETFEKMDELEKIKYDIISKTKLAVNKIELGMTESEVINLIGEPRAKDNWGRDVYFNYGNAWIIFESNVVACIVKSSVFSKMNFCRTYRENHKNSIIK